MNKKNVCGWILAIIIIACPFVVRAQGETREMDDPILQLSDAVRHNYVESFDYPDVEVIELVKIISKMTGKNFILDPSAGALRNKKISIIGPSKITVQDAYFAFLTALDMHRLTIVPEGRFLKITTAADAMRSPIPLYTGDHSPPSSNIITRIYRLQHIAADSVARDLEQLRSRDGRVAAYAPTNTLIMTDSGSNIQRLVSIIEILDVPGFQERMEIIPIHFASANEIATLIDTILEADIATAAPRTRTARARAATVQAKQTIGGGVISKIIADERTNSLIVLANDRGLEELKALVERLDSAEPSAKASNIHVYYCKFAKAGELANTLSALISGAAVRRTTPARTAVRGAATPAAAQQAIFEGDIKITADDPTNSLVITASREDYEGILRVLDMLDIPRRQVFVEAVFLEVEVGKGLTWGLSTNVSTEDVPRVTGFVPDPAGIGAFISGDPTSALQNLSGFVLGFTAGKKLNMNIGGKTVTVGSIQGLMHFIESLDFANVLSRPTILALDNQEASISITDEVPTMAGSTISASGLAQQNIEKQRTGIQLKITPQINATGFVRLQIAQSVSEPSLRAVPSGLRATSVGVSSREATTTVVVNDGDSVVIGGLIRDKESDSNQKVPVLGDIPILGWAFKTANPSLRRTNLLMFVTPHVIHDGEGAHRVRQAMLLERQKWLRENRGGKDAYEEFARDLYNNETLISRTTRLDSRQERRDDVRYPADPWTEPLQPTWPDTDDDMIMDEQDDDQLIDFSLPYDALAPVEFAPLPPPALPEEKDELDAEAPSFQTPPMDEDMWEPIDEASLLEVEF